MEQNNKHKRERERENVTTATLMHIYSSTLTRPPTPPIPVHHTHTCTHARTHISHYLPRKARIRETIWSNNTYIHPDERERENFGVLQPRSKTVCTLITGVQRWIGADTEINFTTDTFVFASIQ